MTAALSGVHYKGFTVQNLLAYVSERFGEETARAAVESLSPELRTHTDPRTALAVGWVPVETYFGIVEYVVNHHFEGNATGAQTIGYEVTLRDIHSIFKMVLRFTTPSMVLGMARRMWRSYCDQGELVHSEEDGVGVLTLRQFAYQTPVSINELAGGFKAYLECSSAKNPRVEVIAPAADGALRWRIRSG
ncbi:hypothetical protein HPC49_04170 [Pyxidicoccus fallax]|uniref:TIGR02265 family protein n=1 Tax=Pyxidicoccus fallax TaxID=394095 RepID=A0A848LHD2_9BACT|nr:hypothetical protein [Pyxidicoccus fallax]NPC77447.1 hypothetical protein [Pyxidicoccus fallax]